MKELKAVFHKFYLVHLWIPWPKWSKIKAQFTFLTQSKRVPVAKIIKNIYEVSFLDFILFLKFHFPSRVWKRFSILITCNHIICFIFHSLLSFDSLLVRIFMVLTVISECTLTRLGSICFVSFIFAIRPVLNRQCWGAPKLLCVEKSLYHLFWT